MKFVLGRSARKASHAVALHRWAVPPVVAPPEWRDRLYGNDVVLAELAAEIKDVTPIPIDLTPLGAGDLKAKLEAVGFGVAAKDGLGDPSGNRKVGTFVLEAVSGNAFATLFGSEQAFAESYAKMDPDGAEAGLAEAFWSRAQLLAGHELLAKSTSAETCYADSGGPLLRGEGKARRVVGVVSAGFNGAASSCMPLGTIFATFGPVTAPFLAKTLGIAPTGK